MRAKAIPSATTTLAYQPLVIGLAAVCAGIVVDRVVPLALGWSVTTATAALASWWLLWRAGRLNAAAVLLLISLVSVGAAWHHVHWSLYPADHVGLLAPEVPGPSALEVTALGGPRRIPPPAPDPLRTLITPERTRLDVAVLSMRDADEWREASGTATLFVDGHVSDLHPGDRLRVFAQWATIARPQNPGEFDFARQARGDRRLCSLRCEFPECVTHLSAAGPWSGTRLTDWLRSRGDALLWQHLDPRRAGLASAMFLGSREELEPDAAQAFLKTGTIHLLVISGLNMGIMAGTLLLILRVMLVPRAWALAVVALTAVAYAATTDSQPPVVRATVMVLVACLAKLLGRRALAFNSIAVAGLVVLALNPAELFHAGTQLSFLSVGVLAWLSQRRLDRPPRDPLDRLIARTRSWPRRAMRWLGERFVRVSIASALIWIVVCPLVMARFHLVSPIAVVLGPVLEIPVTFAMAAGFGVFALGWMTPALASLLGWLCDRNLLFMETCVKITRQWPGNHTWVSLGRGRARHEHAETSGTTCPCRSRPVRRRR
jgi:competence protein ComEC